MPTKRKDKEPKPVVLDIGKTVRRLREAGGLSGVEFCRRGKGIDPKTLTALEKGRIVNPSIATLRALAAGFGMTVSGLFRQAELEREEYVSLGTQKGLYKIQVPIQGVQLISFTPVAEEIFCGKVLVDPQKFFDEKLLGRSRAVFLQVLIGRFEGDVDGKAAVLKEGDNLFFLGGMKFCMTNAVQRQSTLLLITTPSCFLGQNFSISQNAA